MAEPLRLLAAGGLEHSLADIDWGPDLAFQAQLGPSGFWCRVIETGERWNVFASADAGHPASLHAGAWPRRPGLEPDAPLDLLAVAAELAGLAMTYVDLANRLQRLSVEASDGSQPAFPAWIAHDGTGAHVFPGTIFVKIEVEE